MILYLLYYINNCVLIILMLEIYVNYLENFLCLYSNNINLLFECLEDEMYVFNNCNCFYRYYLKYIVLNEWGLWIFEFIFFLFCLIKIIEVVLKIKLLMLIDD